MVALAEVFRRFADDYLSQHSASVLPSHRRAIADILACRTQTLGGHLWRCNHCSNEVYSYHSCKNRSCPRCHQDQTEQWIAACGGTGIVADDDDDDEGGVLNASPE